MWMRVLRVDDQGKVVAEGAKVVVPKKKNAVPDPTPMRFPPCQCDRCTRRTR
jgi:hypothetical protein